MSNFVKIKINSCDYIINLDQISLVHYSNGFLQINFNNGNVRRFDSEFFGIDDVEVAYKTINKKLNLQ